MPDGRNETGITQQARSTRCYTIQSAGDAPGMYFLGFSCTGGRAQGNVHVKGAEGQSVRAAVATRADGVGVHGPTSTFYLPGWQPRLCLQAGVQGDAYQVLIQRVLAPSDALLNVGLGVAAAAQGARTEEQQLVMSDECCSSHQLAPWSRTYSKLSGARPPAHLKPAAWPVLRPKRPPRLGPCLWPSPGATVWHCAHLVLKIFAPAMEKG
jgi:hypothetical protein